MYKSGGSIDKDDPIYVSRSADKKIIECLENKNLCCVIGPRQTGKSSLAIRADDYFKKKGICSIFINIQDLAGSKNKDSFFYSFLSLIIERSFISIDLSDWWHQSERKDLNLKILDFFKFVLLSQIEGDVYIFIDEIEELLNLDKDTKKIFFSLIYLLYKDEHNYPIYKRINFTLIGITPLSDLNNLINFGEHIDLQNFKYEESKFLEKGLCDISEDPSETFKSILEWTNGQPYLTQYLCDRVINLKNEVKNIIKGDEKETIKRIVEESIANDQSLATNHFNSIFDLLKRASEKHRLIYYVYIKILDDVFQNQKIYFDIVKQLKLIGIVEEKNSEYTISNRIYREKFNKKEIENKQLEIIKSPFDTKIIEWLSSKKGNNLLLNKDELIDYQKWAVGKSLDPDEHEFLQESIALNERKKNIKIIIFTLTIFTIISTVFILVRIKNYCPSNQIRIDSQLCFLYKSSGENLFFPTEKSFDIQKEKYSNSVKYFSDLIRNDSSNPEIKIYFNNAKAKLKAEKIVKIAVVVPITSNPEISKSILRGVSDAQYEFNNQNKNIKLEVIICNDENEPHISEKVAKKLIREDIVGVIGHNSSRATKNVLDIYKKHNIPIISSTSSRTSLSRSNSKKSNFFRTVQTDSVQNMKLVEFMNNQNIDKIIIFYDKSEEHINDLNKEFKHYFLKKSENKIISSHDLSLPNYEIKKILNTQDSTDTSIVIFSSTQSIKKLINLVTLNDQLANPFNLFGNDIVQNIDVSSYPKIFNDFISVSAWAVSDIKTDYESDFMKNWGIRLSDWRSVTSYKAVKALTSVIYLGYSREEISKNIKNNSEIKFDEFGDIKEDPTIIQFREGVFRRY